jgi:hypothetical protein
MWTSSPSLDLKALNTGTESISSSSGNWSATWCNTDQTLSATPEEDRTNAFITTLGDFVHCSLDVVVLGEFGCGEI